MRSVTLYVLSLTLLFRLLVASAQTINSPETQVLPHSQEKQNKIDPVLLKKVRPIYPDVSIEPRTTATQEPRKARFSLVQEVARVSVPNGKEFLVVLVGWTIPAALVEHGGGELLFFADARDDLPLVRKSTFGIMPVRPIGQRWLQLGSANILLPFTDREALLHFEKQGDGAPILGLAREAIRSALVVYREEGRDAFLTLVPIRGDARQVDRLPDRLSGYELYPSLVPDSRYSFFKYLDSWEATVFARLIPADPTEKHMVVEIGARGLTAGIEPADVELFVWKASGKEPTDRPARSPGGSGGPSSGKPSDE